VAWSRLRSGLCDVGSTECAPSIVNSLFGCSTAVGLVPRFGVLLPAAHASCPHCGLSCPGGGGGCQCVSFFRPALLSEGCAECSRVAGSLVAVSRTTCATGFDQDALLAWLSVCIPVRSVTVLPSKHG
jgi:hypothetical protein